MVKLWAVTAKVKATKFKSYDNVKVTANGMSRGGQQNDLS